MSNEVSHPREYDRAVDADAHVALILKPWLRVTLEVWPEGTGLSLGTPSLAVTRHRGTTNQGCA